MRTYVIRRLIYAAVVIFLVSFGVFLLLHLTPGDPVLFMLGEEASWEVVEALRAELKLDQPLIVQYSDWLFNFLRGDLGKSIMYRDPVIELIAKRLPITLHIGLLGMVLTIILGLPAGLLSAVRRGTFLDQIITVFANIGISIPVFWLGILGIYLFGFKLGWLPIQGYTSPFDDFWLSTMKLIMPVLCIGIVPIASIARQTRSAMLEVTRQDYIRNAWAKGFQERYIIIRHGLKNALIPVVTLVGVQVAHIIVGSVFIENVFNIPGIGRLIVTATFDKDITVVQGCIMLIAVVTSFINLAVDLVYGWIDPRIHYD